MKIRMHAGGFAESMATAETIEPTMAAVAGYVSRHLSEVLSEEDFSLEPYGGIDRRNGWHTHLICIKGQACGMTDGPTREP